MHALACAPFCTNRDWGSAAPSLAIARVLSGSTSKRWTLVVVPLRCLQAWAVDKSSTANVAPVVVSTMNRAEAGPRGSGKHLARHKALAKAKEYLARLARGVAMADGAARNQNRAERGRTQHLRAF